MSLKTGTLPQEWKRAAINPIFKKGVKTDPGNYKPVLGLPVVSKFIEHIVHKRLYDYLTSSNMLCLEQSGFRKKHSFQSSLHRPTEQFYNDLYVGKVVGMIALDLQKAFDSVNHCLLT